MRRRILESEEESTMSTEFELVGTASITEETQEVTVQFSKPCTELFIIAQGLLGTNGQLMVGLNKGNKCMPGMANDEINTTRVQNATYSIRKLSRDLWIKEGKLGYQYSAGNPNTLRQQFYNLEEDTLDYIKFYPQYGSLTAGSIEVYGR